LRLESLEAIDFFDSGNRNDFRLARSKAPELAIHTLSGVSHFLRHWQLRVETSSGWQSIVLSSFRFPRNLAEIFPPPAHNESSHTPGNRASKTRPPTRPAKLFGWTTLASFSFVISRLGEVMKSSGGE
jgi:hypothetical protein